MERQDIAVVESASAVAAGRVVEIVPEYEGQLFFVLDDGCLVIVDPTSLQIGLVLNA